MTNLRPREIGYIIFPGTQRDSEPTQQSSFYHQTARETSFSLELPDAVMRPPYKMQPAAQDVPLPICALRMLSMHMHHVPKVLLETQIQT